MSIEEILKFISKSKGKSFLEIARYFRIKPKDNSELNRLLGVLQRDHKIVRNEKDLYYVPVFVEKVVGTFSLATKGSFGFVDYDIDEVAKTKKSIFVKSFNFNGAITNDVVEVSVFENPNLENKENNKYGIINRIIERGNETIIGFIKHKNSSSYFVPVDKRFKNGAWTLIPSNVKTKLNDLVVAKILRYEGKNVFVTVDKVITNEADPMVFVKSFLEQIKAPSGFPEYLNEEINKIPDSIDLEDKSNRRDLREEMIVTIDGDDTKDFDDAINVKKLPNGNFKLGVYIADVSHYVQEDTLIDKEALARGTSIYLVDRVIPMLPEKLSNGICSLNPDEDRFVLACEIEIDSNGNNVSIDIFEGIIKSKFRLTYKNVNKYYQEGFIDASMHPELLGDLTKMLNDAKELSLILHNFKREQGYVDFEIDEPKIKLDQQGNVADIIINKRGFSEVLIEDFMVRANEVVAETLYKNKLPVLYRVHDLPDEEKLQNLENSFDVVNLPLPNFKSYNITPKNFAQYVEEIKKLRDDDFVKLLFLRTMQKAKYSDTNIKHFGLASDYYCHFTSPIRRYPDLIIHRIIRNFLINKEMDKLEKFKLSLEAIGEANSNSEQKAVQIEREVNDLKFAEYFKNKIGQSYKAQILSVLAFGFFVEFEFKASGLVHKTNLFDGDFELNENSTKLISKNKVYTIGDTVDVTIVGVDLVDGKVDCVLTDQYDKYLQKLKADSHGNNRNKTERNKKK
ncbi:ribonuclease R [Mycoplasmopsis sturni]|uniref:ribonuclease R n=1 Tax=Mycoplasmopsis sturni TaxID=39047 RepID=UPI0005672190|nr:ribonuclease R [Mycoplasmopsis sturni]